MALSLVIRGGEVHDGSGSPARRADVAVEGDRVVEIGDTVAEGAPTLDATGLVVCPGFINVLSHSLGTLQRDGRGASELLQGVTTEVFGEAFSPGPATTEVVESLGAFGAAQGQRADFARLSDGLDHLERQRRSQRGELRRRAHPAGARGRG